MDKVEAILKQTPSFIKQDKIMKEIYSIQGQTFNELDNKTRYTFEQLFIDSATWGLRRWEEMLGINVDPNKSDEDRRAIIKSKLIGSKTTTKQLLLEFLATFGYTDVKLTENTPPFTQVFDINHYLNTNTSNEMMSTLRDIFPAHLQGVLNLRSDKSIVEYINPNTSYVNLNNPQEMCKQIANIRLDKNGTNISFMNVESDNPGAEVILDYMVLEPTEGKLQSTGASTSNSPSNQTTEFGGWTRKVVGTWSSNIQEDNHCISSDIAGEYMEWEFEGNHIRVMGMRRNDLGMAKIILDGVDQAVVDLYNATTVKDVVMFEKKGLTKDKHTIRVETTGSRNLSSKGTKIILGGIKYHAFRVRMDLSSKKQVQGEEYLNGSAVLMDKLNEEYNLQLDGYISAKLFGKVSPNGGLLAINTAYKDKIGYSNDNIFNREYVGAHSKDKKTYVRANADILYGYDSSGTFNSYVTAYDFDTGIVKWKVSAKDFLPSRSAYQWKMIADKNDNFFLVLRRVAIQGSPTENDEVIVVKINNNGTFNNAITLKNITGNQILGEVVYNKNLDRLYLSVEESGINNVIYAFDCNEFSGATVKVIRNDYNKILSFSPEISYGTGWRKIANNKCINGIGKENTFATGSLTFRFKGTGFRWHSLSGPENGIAKITVDTLLPVEVDTYSATEKSTIAYEKTGLTDKEHVVKIELLNKKNKDSNGIRQVIDYFSIDSNSHSKYYMFPLGEVNGEIYALDIANANSVSDADIKLSKYDADLYALKRVNITNQDKYNFVVGNDRVYMTTGNLGEDEEEFYGAINPKVVSYRNDLVVDMNKVSPVGMKFFAENNKIVGIKEATFKEKVDIMQLDDRFNEEWTTTFTRTFDNRDEYEFFYRLFIDKDELVRLSNKQSAGFKKRLTIF